MRPQMPNMNYTAQPGPYQQQPGFPGQPMTRPGMPPQRPPMPGPGQGPPSTSGPGHGPLQGSQPGPGPHPVSVQRPPMSGPGASPAGQFMGNQHGPPRQMQNYGPPASGAPATSFMPPQMRPPGPQPATNGEQQAQYRPPGGNMAPQGLGSQPLRPAVSRPPFSGQNQPGPPPVIRGSHPPGPIHPGPPPNSSASNELPLPYGGLSAPRGDSPALTPNSSEPPSQKSSRGPSPVPGQQYDAMEGQFNPNAASPEKPPNMYNQPRPGITGRRQYPQQQMTSPQDGYGTPPPPMPNYNQPQGQFPATSQGQFPAASQGQFPAASQGQFPSPQGQGQYTSPTQHQQPGMMPGPMTGPYPGNQTIPNNYTTSTAGLTSTFSQMSFQNGDQRPVNLLQERTLIPPQGAETSTPVLPHDFKKVNCNPDIFRCTVNTIPQTQQILNKSRLPLGLLIHPFRDLSQLPVIQSSVIVRCRSCRTYINPFVTFIDQRRWKCNLCFRVNELPDEFQFDPVSKTYGDPQRRPEIKSATIEFIAPSEYMLRPPQPAVYLFVLDVSFNAIQTGYLSEFCQVLLDNLDKLPGDSRTRIGFVTYDRTVHFYNLAEGLAQPQMLIVTDTDDIFVPCPDNLLVNLHESKELVLDLLNSLPNLFEGNMETGNALGAALQAGYKLMSTTGGRVSVFNTCLPTVGPGSLKCREDPNERAGKDVSHIGPATDFYKKLALDCSGQQIAVDLFLLNSQYCDIATISCAAKFSGGCLNHYPSYHSKQNPGLVKKFSSNLKRYFTRKIGFEAVMRIRCTRGLSIHTFHGNFFVRSTDLLSLPNINPDAGFGMQMSIEDPLTDNNTVCFQAALLYTSSKAERRIRVHTLCLPVSNNVGEVLANANQQAIVGLISKMAVDRTLTSSLSNAKEAITNAAVDAVGAFMATLPAAQRVGMLALPPSLRLLPLYVIALLKSLAFRMGTSTKLDERVFAMEMCKSLPLDVLMKVIHPNLYPIHALDDKNAINKNDVVIPQPPILQLSSANIDRHGVYLMDQGIHIYILVGGAVSDRFCQEVFDRANHMSLPEGLQQLPELDNPTSQRVRAFIGYLQDQRAFQSDLLVIREDSPSRAKFIQHLIEDRTESSLSYYEFLQHIQKQVKS